MSSFFTWSEKSRDNTWGHKDRPLKDEVLIPALSVGCLQRIADSLESIAGCLIREEQARKSEKLKPFLGKLKSWLYDWESRNQEAAPLLANKLWGRFFKQCVYDGDLKGDWEKRFEEVVTLIAHPTEKFLISLSGVGKVRAAKYMSLLNGKSSEEVNKSCPAGAS